MIEYKVKVHKTRTEWYFNGKLHRKDDLPAVENVNGDKEWWLNDKRHRENGAAIEYADGCKVWYINGMMYSEEEFNTQKVKELTVKEITELLGYNIKIIK